VKGKDDMPDVFEAFFEQYTHQYFPGLADIVGSCRFDIEGRGSWTLTITKGVVTVAKSNGEADDCVITGSEQDFVRMIQQQQNPLTAYLQGRIRVTGSISLAQLGMRIFRMRPEEIATQRK
jgi:putative sterol carrier protein